MKLSRRDLLKLSGLAALSPALRTFSQETAADHSIEIASTAIELAPRQVVKTVTYNGQVPGPLLRLKEGRPVTIEVTNRTDAPEVVHWHGLFLPPDVDGAMEEGTPAILPGGAARYVFTPRPAGFRWYHTHTMAMNDLSRAQYGGQHGFLMIDAQDDPGRFDQEFFLALHDWRGYLLASDDGAMNPSYAVATINGKVLGHGEPLRVKQGQRILLHVLNSSPTEVHWLSLSGHALRVIALDGNAVPTPRVVPMIRLAPGERVCATVEMNNPGVWVLGEVRKHVQALGMGVVIEYAHGSGAPRWVQPADLSWNYEQFAADRTTGPSSDDRIAAGSTVIPLVFEAVFRGHGAMERWTINGESYPDTRIQPLVRGQRYRLQFINKSIDDHPLHLHRHSFEVRSLGRRIDADSSAVDQRDLRGIIKDVVLVDAQTVAEVEFTADNPGATLFHCHQQNHMDLGFMMLLNYA